MEICIISRKEYNSFVHMHTLSFYFSFMATVNLLARILLIVGGLNWGLEAFGMNAVNSLFGAWPQVVMVVYVLVGLAALWEAYNWLMTGKK